MNISLEDFKKKLDSKIKFNLLDVREEWETEIVCFPNSRRITKELLDEILDKWDRDEEIIIYCHHGVRSMEVVMFLKQQGFRNVCNLNGGIHQFSLTIDPSLPRY